MAGNSHEGSLWGGRFRKESAPEMAAISQSTHFDWVLADYDLRGSIAHANALRAAGVLTETERDTLVSELESLRQRVEAGTLVADAEDEDVHGALERMLVEALGPDLGGKIRAGRSRNDQIATLVRLYLRDATADLARACSDFVRALAERASEHTDSVMPGRTHMQHAQPIVCGHHLLAHAWPQLRNLERLRDLRSRLTRSPYGSGALAGATLGLDANAVARELGFAGITENSLDATSSRDLVAEALYVCAQIGIDLSRLAEDIIVWSTAEFGYITLDDAYSTGSSIMPQKKNPDIAELARGKVGRLVGNLTGILTTLKGLPLAYNRDLQEDKEPLFDSVETLMLVLPAMTGLVSTMAVHPDALRSRAEDGFSLATDVAEYLVTQGVPFREAHEITGRAVALCEEQSKSLRDLSIEECASLSEHLSHDFLQSLTAELSVKSRTGQGNTAPDRVREQHTQLLATLSALEAQFA